MRLFTFAAALALSLPVLADDTVPPPSCAKPTVPAVGTKLDEKTSKQLNTGANAYQACVQTYLTERRAIAKKHEAIAEANTKATNALASEFNGFAAALEAFSRAHNASIKKSE